ncbi:MAG: aminotransferase class I/II-fold pyridoxal phosphate-dependent enzyme [Acidobacteria bacterium]|nr:MAG: aminotransferase class I/II-fold pyridoxal phosphate-dependent enzyme [Acidobacteriota bacterium]
MPCDRLLATLTAELEELAARGTLKGKEQVITKVIPGHDEIGSRYRLAGEGDRLFMRMNANNYLGLSLRPEVTAAEDETAWAFGTGPGAVRFISGTYVQHVELEERLAAFHERQAGMIFSSAYATTLGVLVPLIDGETAVISDELNHNCIINAMRLARPQAKHIYRHNDLADLKSKLEAAAGAGSRRALVVSDGVFSMRGDFAPLKEIMRLARRYDERFPDNVLVVIDDSHGVGAFGTSGRGTEEHTRCRGDERPDLLIGTLGKALGVNGGYVVGPELILRYLRETAITYIYSNPITPAEAAAAIQALAILDSGEGKRLLAHLRAMTRRFERGLVELGYETIPGPHPVTPVMVRDTAKTIALVDHLFQNGILATGLKYPVVPRGDESIRFQISADHKAADIDLCLEALASFPGRPKAD